jgi:hypothetical protein
MMLMLMAGLVGVGRTVRRETDSRRWRGITVTISISQTKAISAGVKPSGRGNAMVSMVGAASGGCWTRDGEVRRDIMP